MSSLTRLPQFFRQATYSPTNRSVSCKTLLDPPRLSPTFSQSSRRPSILPPTCQYLAKSYRIRSSLSGTFLGRFTQRVLACTPSSATELTPCSEPPLPGLLSFLLFTVISILLRNFGPATPIQQQLQIDSLSIITIPLPRLPHCDFPHRKSHDATRTM